MAFGFFKEYWMLINKHSLHIITIIFYVYQGGMCASPSVNILQNMVNSTYEQCCAMYISNFSRVKYQRKSYLNFMVNVLSLSVNLLFKLFFLPKVDLPSLFEVLVTKIIKIQYFLHLRFENYGTDSNKS